jgi:hypothetical protein
VQELLTVCGIAVAMVLVTAYVIVRFQRSLDRPGGRDGLGGIGDAFGNFIDVFYVQESGAGPLSDHRASDAAHAVRDALTSAGAGGGAGVL